MAVFTIEFGELVDDGFDPGFNDYPIFDESYRQHLNDLIVMWFQFREICITPPARFAVYFKRRMQSIMPYYNKMYETVVMDVNPLYTMQQTTESHTENAAETEANRETNRDESTQGTSSNEDKTRSVFSATPQMQLQGNEDYAANITDAQGNASGTNAGTSNAKTKDYTKSADKALTDYTVTTAGYSGNVGVILDEYRRSLINVDLMIRDELDDLFMQVWTANYSGF